MHDIKWIRDNAAAFDQALVNRGISGEELARFRSSNLLALDDKRRAAIVEAEKAQAQRNSLSKEIGQAKAKKDEARAADLMRQVNEIKEALPKLEEEQKAIESELNSILETIPNVPFTEAEGGPPVGKDEHDNREYHRHGAPRNYAFDPKEHFDLGEAMGGMDFETAAKLSGSRFVVMKQGVARLHRALGQFMLDMHTNEHGYTECNPPLLVKDQAAYGTANLPKFAGDLFHLAPDFWLIPTAEVSLTNFVRESIVTEDQLPMRLTALTPCFRSEAGSAGRDTRGMLRQHQFEKVELVSIAAPETSRDEHERMLWAAENVLKKLDLAFRTVTLCTGDMGFASRKTYDIEVWLPGQKAYREISSCSVCGDFQARRMNARVRNADGKGTRFVHTLNGSGLAVGRALIAVMETYQNEDGSVTIPDALRSYMGGMERIGKA